MESVFDEEDGHLDNMTLSYYARPNVTTSTTLFHQSPDDRLKQRAAIAEKKAKLQALLTGVGPRKDPEKGNSDIENVAGDPDSPVKKKKKKKKKVEEEEPEVDSSQQELDAVSELAPDGEEVPERTKAFFWINKYKSRKNDNYYDPYYALDEQINDYE